MAEIGSGNGSGYPGAIDSDAALEVNASAAGKTKARAEVVNDLAAAIIALQTELGTDPAGSLTNVKTFLQTEHELTGAHKATHVVTVSGTQTITGTKTFINLIASGFMTISGTLGVNAVGTFNANQRINAGLGINIAPPSTGEIQSSGRMFAGLGYTQPGSGGESLRMVRGDVNDDGSVALGTGFSSVKDSTGVYTVTLTTGFSETPTVILSLKTAPGFYALGAGANNASFPVLTFATGGAAADKDFSFIAVGPI